MVISISSAELPTLRWALFDSFQMRAAVPLSDQQKP
jgi:hypothetical protein